MVLFIKLSRFKSAACSAEYPPSNAMRWCGSIKSASPREIQNNLLSNRSICVIKAPYPTWASIWLPTAQRLGGTLDTLSVAVFPVCQADVRLHTPPPALQLAPWMLLIAEPIRSIGTTVGSILIPSEASK